MCVVYYYFKKIHFDLYLFEMIYNHMPDYNFGEKKLPKKKKIYVVPREL